MRACSRPWLPSEGAASEASGAVLWEFNYCDRESQVPDLLTWVFKEGHYMQAVKCGGRWLIYGRDGLHKHLQIIPRRGKLMLCQVEV